jgi:hypothetical protein
MISTIQVDTETKQALFHLKSQIESESGKALSYNDVIKLLLKANETRPKRNLKEFKKFRGIIENAISIMEDGRKIDKEGEFNDFS